MYIYIGSLVYTYSLYRNVLELSVLIEYRSYIMHHVNLSLKGVNIILVTANGVLLKVFFVARWSIRDLHISGADPGGGHRGQMTPLQNKR